MQRLVETNTQIIIYPEDVANASIIWLHGLGAAGDDFVPITTQLNLDPKINMKWIFPHAPIIPVTINNYMRMRAWYDIANFNDLIADPERPSHLGLDHSREIVNNLIDLELKAGILPHKIILAGFSQGGALALYTGLRHHCSLGGIICLSGYLPLPQFLTKEVTMHKHNKDLKILMAHGSLDPVIPIKFAKISFQTLRDLGYTVDWKTYLMPHTVNDQEIYDIGKFINQIIRK